MIYDFSMIVGTLGCISGIKKLVNSISLNQNLNFQVILIIQENFDNIFGACLINLKTPLISEILPK